MAYYIKQTVQHGAIHREDDVTVKQGNLGARHQDELADRLSVAM
jgi:hypothetical protein